MKLLCFIYLFVAACSSAMTDTRFGVDEAVSRKVAPQKRKMVPATISKSIRLWQPYS